MNIFLVLAISFITITSYGWAQFDAQTELGKKRYSSWAFGLGGSRFQYKRSDFSFIGNAAFLNTAWNHTEDRMSYQLGMTAYLGPYDLRPVESLSSDYFGTGLQASVSWGFLRGLRESPIASPALMLGIQYSDFSGESVGTITKGISPEKVEYSDLDSRIIDVSAKIGLQFFWFREPRTHGRDPSDLITRIEGYILSIEMLHPFGTFHTGNYTERRSSANGEITETKIKTKGKLYGTGVRIGLTTCLGL